MSAATLAGVGVLAVPAQTTKVVSSYGPNNQDMTFDEIKAARMAVKAERAKAHSTLLASRYAWRNIGPWLTSAHRAGIGGWSTG